jgi:hypothetical protein
MGYGQTDEDQLDPSKGAGALDLFLASPGIRTASWRNAVGSGCCRKRDARIRSRGRFRRFRCESMDSLLYLSLHGYIVSCNGVLPERAGAYFLDCHQLQPAYGTFAPQRNRVEGVETSRRGLCVVVVMDPFHEDENRMPLEGICRDIGAATESECCRMRGLRQGMRAGSFRSLTP